VLKTTAFSELIQKLQQQKLSNSRFLCRRASPILTSPRAGCKSRLI